MAARLAPTLKILRELICFLNFSSNKQHFFASKGKLVWFSWGEKNLILEKINIKFPNPSFHRRGTQEIRTEDKICPDKHILHIYKQTTQYIKKRTWDGGSGGSLYTLQ